jgi:hypothetical protein
MSYRSFRWKRVLVVSLPTIMAALFVIMAVTGPASAQGGGGGASCPNSNALKNFQYAGNVAAIVADIGVNSTRYSFVSLADENPVGGVPGLIKYCVYPSSGVQPISASVAVVGANGQAWTYNAGRDSFSFGRPSGDPSNIPLDGHARVIGTVVWSGEPPDDEIILLHINDPRVCASSYGNDAPATCFVKWPRPGPAAICDRGDTASAYNAMPFGVVDCPKPSLGFEANSVNEFGDEVELESPGVLRSLTVLFASFGCSDSGHWNTGDCVTMSGATFTVPGGITARIYDPTISLTTPIATATANPDIVFRPTADNTNCTGADVGKWYNPVSQLCQNSISQLVTFINWVPAGIVLPARVIWTVAFNTTHEGYTPIGDMTCSGSPGGCGYDSLNVGAMNFIGAPYAGTDVNPDVVFISTGSATTISSQSGWTGNRPLGEITTQ